MLTTITLDGARPAVTRCKLTLTADGAIVDTFAATHRGLLVAQRAAARRARGFNQRATEVALTCSGRPPEVLVRCTAARCSSGALTGAGDARDAGRRRALLAKQVKFRGNVMTKAQMMEALARQGGVLKRDHFSKYVFSRSAYNRMDADEQRAYDAKLKTKMPFAIELPDGSYFEVTQTEADYFAGVGGSLGRLRRRLVR